MTPAELLEQAKLKSISFSEVIQFIEANYTYTPSGFHNGQLYNSTEQNQGSAKVLYFAQLNEFSKEDTLYLFAEHYQNVLDNPQLDNHQNIRQFNIHGWNGVKFDKTVLI